MDDAENNLTEEDIDRLLSKPDVDVERIATKHLGYGPNCYKSSREEEELERLDEVERENLIYNRSEKRRKLIEDLNLKLRHKIKVKNDGKSDLSAIKSKNQNKDDNFDDDDDISSISSGSHSDSDFDEQRKNKLGKRIISASKKGDVNARNKRSKTAMDSAPGFLGRRRKTRKFNLNQDAIHKADDDEREEKLIGYEEIKLMQVTRDLILKYVNELFILKEFTNGFVKVSDEISGNQAYIIGEVVEFKEGSNHLKVLGVVDGKIISEKSNLKVVIKVGRETKTSHISVISNQPISLQEFDAWKAKMFKDNQQIFTLHDSDLYLRKLKEKVFMHCYTQEEVLEKVRKNKEKNRKSKSINYTTEIAELKRQEIYFQGQITAGLDIDDNKEKLADCRTELAQLEQERDDLLKIKYELGRDGGGASRVNARNRSQNQEEEEQISKFKGSKEAIEAVSKNPLARQPCRPITLWSTSSHAPATTSLSPLETKTMAKEAPKVEPKTHAITASEKVERAAKLSKQRELVKAANLYNELNVEIEIEASPQTDNVTKPIEAGDVHQVPLQQLKVQPKVLMTLEDYLKEQSA